MLRLLAPPFSVFFEVLKIQSPNHCYRSTFGFQLPDRIASVFLLSLFFGERIDYLLSVCFFGHTF
jgi:hypothetical protein